MQRQKAKHVIIIIRAFVTGCASTEDQGEMALSRATASQQNILPQNIIVICKSICCKYCNYLFVPTKSKQSLETIFLCPFKHVLMVLILYSKNDQSWTIFTKNAHHIYVYYLLHLNHLVQMLMSVKSLVES